jgi:L-alanine-DL-glutamate epimerase-like enolase superfamily enzyme
MWWEQGTAAASAALARELVERGYLALKTGPFVERGTRRDRAWLDRTVERAFAIREAIGPGVDLTTRMARSRSCRLRGRPG